MSKNYDEFIFINEDAKQKFLNLPPNVKDYMEKYLLTDIVTTQTKIQEQIQKNMKKDSKLKTYKVWVDAETDRIIQADDFRANDYLELFIEERTIAIFKTWDSIEEIEDDEC